jgi:hypothetical protein
MPNGEWEYTPMSSAGERPLTTSTDESAELEWANDETEDASDVLESVAETVADKNDDYGSAIEKNAVIKRLLAADNVVIRTDDDGTEWVRLGDHDVDGADQQRLDGIFTRLLDKVARLYTLSFTEQDDSVDETRRDTVEDLIGYLAHAAVDGFTHDGSD